MSHVVLGTRGSRLALVQSNWCAKLLEESGFDVEVRVIRTTSDHRPDETFAQIDQRDLFTRQIDDALVSGRIDLAVHSLKDVPTEIPDGMVIAAISERHDPSDVLISDGPYDLDSLPDGATVATSSLRRKAQLLAYRPDLFISSIRGNVETRIRKMREGDADAVVLAKAGLDRLDLAEAASTIDHSVLLPAVGQGALGIAMMGDHPSMEAVREAVNSPETEAATLAERAMLRTLEGGCRVPVGGYAIVTDGEVNLKGLVASVDGAMVYRAEARGEEPEVVGRDVAENLISQGAEIILSEVRQARSTG